MKKRKLIILFSIFYFLFSIPLIAQSQEVDNQLANFIQNTPLVNAPLVNIVFNVIRYLLGFLGVVAVIILIYGGFLWMTARGNEEQVQKAKKTIINGLIGLIIVMLSFAIVQFVIGPLLRGGVGGGGGPGGGGGGGGPSGARYLVMTSKYPRPGTNVARNNKIIITFNQNLDENSVKLARPKSGQPDQTDCTGYTVAIKQGNNFLDGSLKVIGNTLIFIPKSDCPPPLNVINCQERNPQNCSLELIPDGCCGCFPTGSISVTLIGGANGLRGTRIFGNQLAQDINWQFNVGNYLETNPPRVESNLPQGNNVPRNVGISVIFSKEIDLSTLKIYNPDCEIGSASCSRAHCGTENCLAYTVRDLDEATIKILGPDGPDSDSDLDPIPGFFERLSAKAFVFRPSQYCPAPTQNCRCFPATSQIRVELTNGIKDVNCNALTDAPFIWSFTTSNSVDLDPPEINSTNPANNATGVDRLIVIEANFVDPSNTPMDSTSINEDTFVVHPDMFAREISTTGMTSTYKPYRVLEGQTRYTSIIFGGGQPGGTCQLEPDLVFGVKDLAGNTMINNYSWNFTTSNQVNAGEPYIDWLSPTQGPAGQCVTIHGYNLGCCLENPCQTDLEGQKGRWTGTFCREGTQAGKVEFYNFLGSYSTSTVLVWQEIRKPDKCIPPNCPTNCSSSTCPTAGANVCESCVFCSKSPADCGTCWCPMPPNYSPENEIIVRVPENAANQSASQPGQIKVTPAY